MCERRPILIWEGLYHHHVWLRGRHGRTTDLGQEIGFRADYDLWTNFKVQGKAGWLVPSEGDTAHEYVLQFLYNF